MGLRKVKAGEIRRRNRKEKRAPSHDEALSLGSINYFAELENHYIRGLQTLGALLDGEFHLLAFLQVLKAFAANCGKVDKDVGAAIASDETVALGPIEPLNRADDTFSHICLLSKKKKIG